MITDEQLAEWRALCDKATPGPWRPERTICGNGERLYRVKYPAHGLNEGASFEIAHLVTTEGGLEQQGHDARLVATARTAMPQLLEEVERLRAEVERMEELYYDALSDAVDAAKE